MMKTSTPLAILLPLILLSTATFSLDAQTPYMDAMYIDVRWDRTDTLGEATMRLEYRMRFPSETGPDRSYVDRRIVEIGPELQKEYSLILETSEMAGHNAWKQTDGAFDSHDPERLQRWPGTMPGNRLTALSNRTTRTARSTPSSCTSPRTASPSFTRP